MLRAAAPEGSSAETLNLRRWMGSGGAFGMGRLLTAGSSAAGTTSPVSAVSLAAGASAHALLAMDAAANRMQRSFFDTAPAFLQSCCHAARSWGDSVQRSRSRAQPTLAASVGQDCERRCPGYTVWRGTALRI